jgi:hypothetical protein
MSAVIHIAPQLPPAVDGVGDYCWNLWRHWPEPLPPWKFSVLRGAEETSRLWPEVEVHEFKADGRSLAAALERSDCSTAVLHYVGYGFQPKGIPIWLPGAIADWKSARFNRRLVTMFHEMYARSSPLRSPFWVAPMARKIIRRLVELSDSWVTSCERYFDQLTTEFSARPQLGHVLPIGSNIPVAGDLQSQARAVSGNGFRIALFGLARTRLWALTRHWRLLRALSDAGAIDFITLLGKPNSAQDERAWRSLKKRIGPKARWNLRFNLPIEQISQELIHHDLGLLPNEPETLTKSGVFAAFATHGIIPVLCHQTGANVPLPLREIVIARDDTRNVAELRRLHDDPRELVKRREELIAFAARELSWSRITADWSLLIESPERGAGAGRFVTPPPALSDRQSGPIPQRLVTQS